MSIGRSTDEVAKRPATNQRPWTRGGYCRCAARGGDWTHSGGGAEQQFGARQPRDRDLGRRLSGSVASRRHHISLPDGDSQRSGGRTLTGDLSALSSELSALQVAPSDGMCPDIGGTTDRYLLGLTYPDGVVWISSRSNCIGTSNGPLNSPVGIEPQLGAAYEAGHWITQ